MQSLVDSDIYKRKAAFKPFINSISIVDDNFDFENFEDQCSFVEQMSIDIFKMTSSNYVYVTKTNGRGITTYNDSSETKTLFRSVHLEFIETLKSIASKTTGQKAIAVYCLAIKHCDAIGLRETSEELKLKINQLDPSQYAELAEEVAKQKKIEELKEKQRERLENWLIQHGTALFFITVACIIVVGLLIQYLVL